MLGPVLVPVGELDWSRSRPRSRSRSCSVVGETRTRTTSTSTGGQSKRSAARGDEGGIGQVRAERCVDDHRVAEAEVGPGDVKERVVLEGQDAFAVERVGLAVAGVVAGRQQGGLDEAGAHRVLVEVGGGVLAG